MSSLPPIGDFMRPLAGPMKAPMQVADNSHYLPTVVVEQNEEPHTMHDFTALNMQSQGHPNMLGYLANRSIQCKFVVQPDDGNQVANIPCSPSVDQDINFKAQFNIGQDASTEESMETEPSMISQPNDDIVSVDLGLMKNDSINEIIIQYDISGGVVIPGASDLSIQPRGHSYGSPAEEQMQTEEAPMEETQEYDKTHQPDDGVGVLHDHSYGVKDKEVLDMVGLDMNKDDDLKEGLDRALPNAEEESPPPSPTSTSTLTVAPTLEKSQEDLTRSLKNRKLLLRELRESKIRCLADVMRLNTDKMRQLAPRLVRFLMYQNEDHAKRGIYKIRPMNWPEGKFFGDPCNKKSDGTRPNKNQIKEMCLELYKMYQNTTPIYTEEGAW